MSSREALAVLCHRCVAFQTCQGTGCEPKKELEKLVEKNKVSKPIEKDGFRACPECGAAIGRDAKYCKTCGKRIEE